MKRLIIVDISNFIFRAFYAIRVLNAPDGTPVNAVYGILSMVLKLLSQYQPSNLLFARDSKGPKIREQIYKEYKANRSDPPDDLIPQFDLIQKLIDKMGLPQCTVAEYEADDVIGSAVIQWKKKFDEILILSGDKDLMQFVDDKVKVIDTMKDKIYGPQEVFDKMGVWPNQIVDYLSIVGDSSDNIPGMKGIGAKGAAKLLAEHGTLDKCVKAKDSFTNKRIHNAFRSFLDDAYLSKELIQIVTDLDLGMKYQETAISFHPSKELLDFLKKLGFKGILKKLEEMAYNEYQAKQLDKKLTDENLKINADQEKIKKIQDKFKFINIIEKNDFKKLEKKLENHKKVAIYLEYQDNNFFHNEPNLLRLSLSLDGKTAYIITTEDLLKKTTKEIWGSKDYEVISLFPKRDLLFCMMTGFTYKAKFFDITQIHYLLNPSYRHDLQTLTMSYLDYQLKEIEKDKLSLAELEDDKSSECLGERAICLFQLAAVLQKELKKNKMEKVYNEIDGPLTRVLAEMENEGIILNVPFFKKLEEQFSKQLKKIEDKIEHISGIKINLKSPKQVSELLFDHLDLPVIKKIKTGASTDSEVLEELDSRNLSEVPRLILNFRELDKILSTYVKTLPQMISTNTKRLHTNFNQHVVATGRLSSEKPNLQNIPIRTDNGRKVRKGFIARPGWLLLSADYSQVELRILAHLSQDPTMMEAFKNKGDIHTQTASEVLNIPISKVKSEDRSIAKAVNFGLMYGQSSFGLAKTLKISRNEARDYIIKYFERFSKVKAFIDTLKESCEVKGFTETLYGRKRFLPDIHSSNRTIKAMAEREAINSPIQGTAADIIKMAMINIDQKIRSKKLQSKILLQVHDELIFEVPEDEIDFMKDLVKDKMENVVKLSVPLEVKIALGVNWYDLK